jgi:hypothetical protein
VAISLGSFKTLDSPPQELDKTYASKAGGSFSALTKLGGKKDDIRIIEKSR